MTATTAMPDAVLTGLAFSLQMTSLSTGSTVVCSHPAVRQRGNVNEACQLQSIAALSV